MAEPLLTVFSTPKPFEGQIGLIQRNAIRSWQALAPSVQVLVLGDEPGAERMCRELGVRFIPSVARNEYGTPLISSIFKQAARHADADLMCYVNADILLVGDLLSAVESIASHFHQFLIVGRRWDVEIQGDLDLEQLQGNKLKKWLEAEGVGHKPSGSDYFVYRRGMFGQELPDFALGRSGWDNWMVYSARSRKIPVVDASNSITVIHQNHDYGHLPEGRSHYGLPESHRNVQLGGGPETVFTLRDATHRLDSGKLRQVGVFERGLIRSIEAWLYTRLRAKRARGLTRLLFHPIQTIRYLMWRMRRGERIAEGSRTE